MAKAKRRGRPPGSKNKVRNGSGQSAATMDVGQLRAHIDNLQQILAKKVSEQRAYFEGELARLDGYGSNKTAAVSSATHRTGMRAKAKPKYQSKKDVSLKWSGRGIMPVWMRDEIKGTKLTKDSFLIK